jgi:aspartate/methionine/tyrosine aminotransferase
MSDFETRNRYFDRLFNTPGLRWMGQNTNHYPLPETVRQAMIDSILADEFRAYAPPLGFEELRAGIVEDLGLEGAVAMVTDGGVEALYHLCHSFLKAGDKFVTTDPSWKWPLAFSRAVGAEVVEIPIYDESCGYRLSAAALERAVDERTRLIYLVDPNNPLGSCIAAEDMHGIVAIARRLGAVIVHDCTYRHFATDHTLAAGLYPEGTLTIYSFSKWLGAAGLRIGAVVGMPDLIAHLAGAPPNNLGSNVVSQRAAMAGLKMRPTWFPEVNAAQRRNQARIKQAADGIPGFKLPVYPSNGNFVVVECIDAGVRPEALVAAMQEHRFLIRQGAYHTARFGHRFIKVSTTVPEPWVVEFCDLLPKLVEQVRFKNEAAELF